MIQILRIETATLLCICLLLAGCSRADGPPRYQLSGEITFDGRPVPFGWIVFAPEHGPGGTANIKDGKYQTPEGFGTIGGMHTIEVVAFNRAPVADSAGENEENSGPLFTHKFRQEIPQKSTTWDIAISSQDL